MRVDIDLTDEDRTAVKEYAERNGLRMSRAYADLIRTGLRAEE
jgi:hypothetical protein